MEPEDRAKIRRVLREAKPGSKKLLDALEKAIDGCPELLLAWDERLLEEDQAFENHWPTRGFPQSVGSCYMVGRLLQGWSQEDLQARNLANWQGIRFGENKDRSEGDERAA